MNGFLLSESISPEESDSSERGHVCWVRVE